MRLTVVILVHKLKYSITDVFNVPHHARIVLSPDLVDDLDRWKKKKKELLDQPVTSHIFGRIQFISGRTSLFLGIHLLLCVCNVYLSWL